MRVTSCPASSSPGRPDLYGGVASAGAAGDLTVNIKEGFRVTSEQKKRFRDRATRAARELKKEKASFGCINDGGGKRYRIGVFFLLAGDVERANEEFDWFYEEFPDDAGEPIFHLYSAITAYRHGDMSKARRRLLDSMLSNIFLLPYLVGKKFSASGIWHPSNWYHENYIFDKEELLKEPTNEEKNWISMELSSASFVALRDGYVATYRALNSEHDITKRTAILSSWHRLQAEHS